MKTKNAKKTKQQMSVGDIPVVILCGGRGTRLKEETEVIPKPLVPIGGHPILWHIMKLYAAHGFNHFILPVGYKGEKIKEYFANRELFQADFTADFTGPRGRIVHHSPIRERWKVTIVDTGLDAETGARLKRVEPYLSGKTFLLTYGDGVADVNVHALLEFHKKHPHAATVTAVHPPARFGEITISGIRAKSFNEKPQMGSTYINGGFFALDSRVFEFLNDDEKLNFEKDVLPRVAEAGELAVHKHEGYWQCMDTVRDMELLNKEWENGKARWRAW